MLQKLAEETNRWGEVKAKAGKLENELMYARFLTTTDDAVLKAFPLKVVFTLLDKVATYCKLKGLNPIVRVPDSLSRKYFLLPSFSEIALLDLLTWAQVGLAGASQ